MSDAAVVRSRRAGGDRRHRVLDAVVTVLAKRGYAHTRYADVASACGLAVSTMQGYFGSREDMLVEALRRATTREVTALEALAASLDDPWRQLVALVDRGLGTEVATWRMLMEFWTAAAHDSELREHAAWLAARYRQPFAAVIQRGIATGAFAVRHDPAAIVDVLVAGMDGLLHPVVLDHRASASGDYREVVLAQLAYVLGTTGTT